MLEFGVEIWVELGSESELGLEDRVRVRVEVEVGLGDRPRSTALLGLRSPTNPRTITTAHPTLDHLPTC